MDTVNEFPLCRLCLYRSRCVVDLFEENGRHGYIAADAIEELLQLKVSKSDGYPQNVCPVCLDKLTDFKIFKEQCKESSFAFRKVFIISRGTIGSQELPDVAVEQSVKDEPTDDDIQDDSQFKVVMQSITCEPTDEDIEDDSQIETSTTEKLDMWKAEETNTICQEVFIKTEMVDWNYEDNTCNETRNPASRGEENMQENQSSHPRPIPHHPEIATSPNDQPSASNWRPMILGSQLAANKTSRVLMAPNENLKGPMAPYECTFCHKLFPYMNYLVRHEQKHTQERQHKCTVCQKAFLRAHDLMQHNMSHTGERPFKCNVCDKRFSIKSNMVMHLRTHLTVKPYKCDDCGKGFTQKGNLLIHKRTHTGERPYVCTICGKAFIHVTNLKSHSIVHTRFKRKMYKTRKGGVRKGVCQADATGAEKTAKGADSGNQMAN